MAKKKWRAKSAKQQLLDLHMQYFHKEAMLLQLKELYHLFTKRSIEETKAFYNSGAFPKRILREEAPLFVKLMENA